MDFWIVVQRTGAKHTDFSWIQKKKEKQHKIEKLIVKQEWKCEKFDVCVWVCVSEGENYKRSKKKCPNMYFIGEIKLNKKWFRWTMAHFMNVID